MNFDENGIHSLTFQTICDISTKSIYTIWHHITEKRLPFLIHNRRNVTPISHAINKRKAIDLPVFNTKMRRTEIATNQKNSRSSPDCNFLKTWWTFTSRRLMIRRWTHPRFKCIESDSNEKNSPFYPQVMVISYTSGYYVIFTGIL